MSSTALRRVLAFRPDMIFECDIRVPTRDGVDGRDRLITFNLGITCVQLAP
jgi:hypothetical protein